MSWCPHFPTFNCKVQVLRNCGWDDLLNRHYDFLLYLSPLKNFRHCTLLSTDCQLDNLLVSISSITCQYQTSSCRTRCLAMHCKTWPTFSPERESNYQAFIPASHRWLSQQLPTLQKMQVQLHQHLAVLCSLPELTPCLHHSWHPFTHNQISVIKDLFTQIWSNLISPTKRDTNATQKCSTQVNTLQLLMTCWTLSLSGPLNDGDMCNCTHQCADIDKGKRHRSTAGPEQSDVHQKLQDQAIPSQEKRNVCQCHHWETRYSDGKANSDDEYGAHGMAKLDF